MATDTTRLLLGLQEYHTSLQRHLQTMTQAHAVLAQRWGAFSEVYEGSAAEQFRRNWLRTEHHFQTYIAASHKMSKLLEERIASLTLVDRPGELG